MRPSVIVLRVLLDDLVDVRQLVARVPPVLRESAPMVPGRMHVFIIPAKKRMKWVRSAPRELKQARLRMY